MKKTQKRGPKPPQKSIVTRAAHMACAGLTYHQIAEKLDKSCPTISSWKRKYPVVWQAACDAWPIFNHKLAAVPLNAEELLHAYCVEMKSLATIKEALGLPPMRVIRFLDYIGIERRKDCVQVKLNTTNAADWDTIARRYKNGASLKALRAETGFSMNTIRTHLKARGIKIRNVSEAKRLAPQKSKRQRKIRKDGKPTAQNPDVVARILTSQVLYERGHNYQEIGDALSCTRQLIEYYTKDPLWTVPLSRAGTLDAGLGFVPHTNAKELMESHRSDFLTMPGGTKTQEN